MHIINNSRTSPIKPSYQFVLPNNCSDRFNMVTEY